MKLVEDAFFETRPWTTRASVCDIDTADRTAACYCCLPSLPSVANDVVVLRTMNLAP